MSAAQQLMLGEGSGLAPYRYLMLKITSCSSSDVRLEEVYWRVGATDYPTVAMTGPTTPSPLVASASSAIGGAYDAWVVFNKTAVDQWISDTSGFPQWIKLDLGTGNRINPTGIGITPYYDTLAVPLAFSCYGSNTGAFAGEQILLYSAAPGTTGWTGHTRRNFTF